MLVDASMLVNARLLVDVSTTLDVGIVLIDVSSLINEFQIRLCPCRL
jgi:hypothetical protein